MGERDEIDTRAETDAVWPVEQVLSVVGALPEARSREAIERTLCDRLVRFEHCRCAWVGDGTGSGEPGVRPRASASRDDDALAAAVDPIERGVLTVPVATAAIREDAVRAATVDDNGFGPLADLAAENGITSLVAVPLRHDDAQFGVLCCYGDGRGRLSERDRTALTALGTATGTALAAAARKQLLLAERTVELRFRFDDPAFLPGMLSRRLEGAVSLDGSLYTETGQWLLYLTVPNGRAEDAVTVVESVLPLADARIVDRHAGRIAVDCPDLPAFDAVAAIGGTVSSCLADGGVVELSVTVPRDRKRQDVASVVRDQFPSCECIATCETDPGGADPRPETSVLSQLTEKQYHALETAVFAGYFDWPRASTAEEVASRLDITSPTFHAHVRKAEHEILSTLLGL